MLRLFGKSKYKIQTFTYYIPSPQPRSTGYREKQFDKIFYNFVNKGYEILSVNTQANNGPDHSGMWVIFVLRALNAKAAALNLTTDEYSEYDREIEFDT